MRELRPFLALLGPHWRRLALGTLLLLGTYAAGIGLLALSGWFITATALAGAGLLTLELFVPSGGIRFFAISRALSRYGERLVNHDAVLRLLSDLRGWLFGELARLPLARLGRLRSADLLNRLIADIDALDNLYLRVLGPTVAAVIGIGLSMLFLGLFAGSVAWAVGAILALGGVLVPALALRWGRLHGEHETVDLPRLRTAITDCVDGMPELRAYAALDRQQHRFETAETRLTMARRRAAGLTAAADAAVSLAGHLAMVAALLVGVALYRADAVSGPVLVLLTLTALAAVEVISPLPEAWQQLGRTRAAAQRLLGVTDVEAVTPQEQWRGGAVRIQALTYRHDRYSEPVLAGVDLELSAGDAMVIVGASGAGKSTLADLIAGLREPNTGAVMLGGVAVSAIPEAQRFARIAYLTQRTELFADTVAANLRLAAPDAEDAQLWAVLEQVALADTVSERPEGLHEWIGEGGRKLSGGQGRRLALARLLLTDPELVLLDEPFSGLDAPTAALLRERMAPWLMRRTVITLSHRPEAAPRSGPVYRLDGGRIYPVTESR